jgi:hypothetical protein
MDSSVHYVEVCDLPYCSEPRLFYQRRMEAGLRVTELRESACRLFGKENGQLTMRDLKLAFLKMCPLKVNLGGNDHKVTIKKHNGAWILSCNCRSWIFNQSRDRSCKHTKHVENLMASEEARWGIALNQERKGGVDEAKKALSGGKEPPLSQEAGGDTEGAGGGN